MICPHFLMYFKFYINSSTASILFFQLKEKQYLAAQILQIFDK